MINSNRFLRVLHVLCCLIMSASVCHAQTFNDNGFNTDPNATGSTLYQQPDLDENGVYLITNAGNLYWFADFVNQGDNNANANAILVNDIVVNKDVLVNGKLNEAEKDKFKTWEPISEYKGTFDGDNHTISGLYYNDNTEQKRGGVFGIVYEEAIIQNLGVVDSYFEGKDDIGGVCVDIIKVQSKIAIMLVL